MGGQTNYGMIIFSVVFKLLSCLTARLMEFHHEPVAVRLLITVVCLIAGYCSGEYAYI